MISSTGPCKGSAISAAEPCTAAVDGDLRQRDQVQSDAVLLPGLLRHVVNERGERLKAFLQAGVIAVHGVHQRPDDDFPRRRILLCGGHGGSWTPFLSGRTRSGRQPRATASGPLLLRPPTSRDRSSSSISTEISHGAVSLRTAGARTSYCTPDAATVKPITCASPGKRAQRRPGLRGQSARRSRRCRRRRSPSPARRSPA